MWTTRTVASFRFCAPSPPSEYLRECRGTYSDRRHRRVRASAAQPATHLDRLPPFPFAIDSTAYSVSSVEGTHPSHPHVGRVDNRGVEIERLGAEQGVKPLYLSRTDEIYISHYIAVLIRAVLRAAWLNRACEVKSTSAVFRRLPSMEPFWRGKSKNSTFRYQVGILLQPQFSEK